MLGTNDALGVLVRDRGKRRTTAIAIAVTLSLGGLATRAQAPAEGRRLPVHPVHVDVALVRGLGLGPVVEDEPGDRGRARLARVERVHASPPAAPHHLRGQDLGPALAEGTLQLA